MGIMVGTAHIKNDMESLIRVLQFFHFIAIFVTGKSGHVGGYRRRCLFRDAAEEEEQPVEHTGLLRRNREAARQKNVPSLLSLSRSSWMATLANSSSALKGRFNC